MNYAAVTVPVGKADVELDQPGEEWVGHVPRNESDGFNHAQCKSYISLRFGLGVRC